MTVVDLEAKTNDEDFHHSSAHHEYYYSASLNNCFAKALGGSRNMMKPVHHKDCQKSFRQIHNAW